MLGALLGCAVALASKAPLNGLLARAGDLVQAGGACLSVSALGRSDGALFVLWRTWTVFERKTPWASVWREDVGLALLRRGVGDRVYSCRAWHVPASEDLLVVH